MGDCVLWGVFLVLILCHQSHSSCETVVKGLCLEETTQNWTEASDSCNLAVFNTPLSVGVSILGVPIFGHRRPQAQRSEPHDIHWIGATGEFTPWFKLLGCFLYHYLTSFSGKLTVSSSIGPVTECHQICEDWNENYKEFGINETHCFCRENEETEKGAVPNTTCKLQSSENFFKDLVGPKYDAGRAGSYDGIAMYRKMNDVTYIEDSLGECLIETEDGNVTYPCDAADSVGYKWTESLQRQENGNIKLPRWTPYIRRLIISEKRVNSALQNGTVCIGIRYQSRAYEPIPLPCSERRTSLCHTDPKTGNSSTTANI
ncbi:uncharacterized protein LOC134261124, partial [Saccostrea cucullata]|uniref:uncharacterized protein LOC134261124 n=1 Tax=Saccostrea cuccullata TaxID=36930 RepID=UPI002ED20637